MHPVLSILTDEELLRVVYTNQYSTDTERELAIRFEHALDDMKNPPSDLANVLTRTQEVDKEDDTHG